MASEQQYGAKPVVELDGSALADGVEELMVEATVEQNRHLPTMFTLRFRDQDRTVIADAGFELGTAITITATPVGDGSQTPLFVGEVVTMEVQYEADGSHTVIRGYDLAHRFMRGRSTRTFTQVSDDDIARELAAAHSVTLGDVDIQPVVYEFVSQVNVSDWEFLRARAFEAGYEVSVDSGDLTLKRSADSVDGPGEGDVATDDPLQLTFGNNLEWFRSRVTAAEQVAEVEVRSWDMKAKDKIVAVCRASTPSARIGVGPQPIDGTYDREPRMVVHDWPVDTQAEADLAASAAAEQIAGTHAEAFGCSPGNPALRAGTPVSVSLTGAPFDGQYVITAATHSYTEEGYKTFFEVTGRQDRSLTSLNGATAAGLPTGAGGSPIYGVVSGIVTDVSDPEDLGRVKLSFPWLDDDYESSWARSTQFGAGPDQGAMFLPEVDHEVLIAFEHGDVRRPFVIGSLYNGQDVPLTDRVISSSGEIQRRGYHSRNGHHVFFDDGGGEDGLLIGTGGGECVIKLDVSGQPHHQGRTGRQHRRLHRGDDGPAAGHDRRRHDQHRMR
jgi:phage protein D